MEFLSFLLIAALAGVLGPIFEAITAALVSLFGALPV
jgi:hypothetical protein